MADLTPAWPGNRGVTPSQRSTMGLTSISDPLSSSIA
jgi:hypothetical protein